jgi:hypothetical protein
MGMMDEAKRVAVRWRVDTHDLRTLHVTAEITLLSGRVLDLRLHALFPEQ